jgi:hypothetical protein
MIKDSDKGQSVITIENIVYTGFSLLLLVFPYCLYVWMNGQGPSDLGALYGAACGFLAVLWFYRGFRLQSLQINEQKKQFLQQMHIQHQDSLLDFLITSSERIEHQSKNMLNSLNLTDTSEVPVLYSKSPKYYDKALKSSDHKEVQMEVDNWLKIESPCSTFMSSVRDIIVLYRRRSGKPDNFEGVDPAEYVVKNGKDLMAQPFMTTYKGEIELLAQFMYSLLTYRKSMRLALIAALLKSVPEVSQKDFIVKQIQEAKKKGEKIPKICDGLYEENSLDSNSKD